MCRVLHTGYVILTPLLLFAGCVAYGLCDVNPFYCCLQGVLITGCVILAPLLLFAGCVDYGLRETFLPIVAAYPKVVRLLLRIRYSEARVLAPLLLIAGCSGAGFA